MPNSFSSVAVIIPAYNEEQNILLLIHRLRKLLPQAKLYVVDGNSADQTVSLVKKQIKKDPLLKLLQQKTKAGRGQAVQMGFKVALQTKQTQYFVEMDADLSHRAQDVKTLLINAGQKKVVIASRYIPGSKIVNWPAWRLRQSKMANQLIRLVLRLEIKDNTNGLRCYPRAAVRALVAHRYFSQGFMALSESAFLLKRLGFVLIEVPSVFTDRRFGKSSAGYKELANSLLNLGRIRLLMRSA